MPQKPIQAPQSYQDMPFPVHGVDLSQGYGAQQPLSTRLGVNVRVYEALTARARGGSRPGLVAFPPEQIPEGSQLIQNLNVVVDPNSDALLDNSSWGDVASEDGTEGVFDPSGPGWFYGGPGPDFPTNFFDGGTPIGGGNYGGIPTSGSAMRTTPQVSTQDRANGRFIRPGGSGRSPAWSTKKTPILTWSNPADITEGTALSGAQLNATASVAGVKVYQPASGVVLPKGDHQPLRVTFTPTDTAHYKNISKTVFINVVNQITFIQQASGGGGIGIFGPPIATFPSAVTAGHLLVAFGAFSSFPADVSGVGISDTLFNAWTLIALIDLGNDGGMRQDCQAAMWYTIANSTGLNTIALSGNLGCGIDLCCVEYSGVDQSAPLDSAVTRIADGAGSPIASPWSTGIIPVSGPNRLVLGAFDPQVAFGSEGFGAGAGFTLRSKHDPFDPHGGWPMIEDLLPSSSSVSAITDGGFNTAASFGYLAIGASFKPT